MFERGVGDGAQGPVAVDITLEEGQRIRGRLLLPPGQSLAQALNGPASFLEFEPSGGGRMFVAKSALQTVKPVDMPAAPKLWAGPTEGADFNPFAVLGVKPGATRQEAHEAYIRLAKIYHPDRYATTELPREVRDYLAVMARRINSAFEALEAPSKREAAKAEPVFTKAGN
jgi:hypothetical protein